MKKVRYDRTYLKQQVLIVGEYLLNFHPGANHDIEAYLEENGFEIIEARMTDVIRKTYFYQDAQIKEYHLNKPIDQKVWYRTADTIFDFAHKLTDSIAKEHPLYEPACRMDELVKDSRPNHSPYLRGWRRCINSRRNPASCQTWLQILPHPPAIWMPSKPCSRTRNHQKIKRNLPRCTDTSTRL